MTAGSMARCVLCAERRGRNVLVIRRKGGEHMALPKQVLMPLTWLMAVGSYLKSQPLDDDEAFDLYQEVEAKLKTLIAREEYAERLGENKKRDD